MANITDLIQTWYQKNKRELPWRQTDDPYKIWLSEIILQQTQVAQGLAYYHKFVDSYPKIADLASQNEEHVLKNWQGLGYYSRARNLHFAAKQVMTDFNGQFPNTHADIIKLKGVGEYTAAAIASFAFNEPYAVVDGNVFRVLSRVFAIDTPINSTAGKKVFFELAQSLIDENDPATHNQAMMELGALVCKPTSPKCTDCPLQYNCVAHEKGIATNFPVKEKKLKVKKRFLNYMVVTDGKNLLINKREGKGIWQGLYDFPLVEAKQALETISEIDGIPVKKVVFDRELKHILTHQHLFVKFWIAELKDLSGFKGYQSININNLEDFPLPQLIVRYIQDAQFFKR